MLASLCSETHDCNASIYISSLSKKKKLWYQSCVYIFGDEMIGIYIEYGEKAK